MKIKLLFVLFIGGMFWAFAQSHEEKGDAFYALGNYSKAIEAYKSVEGSKPVLDKIAKAYVAIGNYAEGLKFYQSAIKLDPENNLLKYEYAKLLMRTNKYDEAKQRLGHLVATDSLNPNFHYQLGLVLEKQKDTTATNAYAGVQSRPNASKSYF